MPDRRAGPAVLAALLAFALYLGTGSTDLGWGDSAQLQLAAARPSLGLGPRAYPLQTALSAALARLPGLDPAAAAALTGMLAGALAVGLTWALCAGLTRSRIGAWSGAAALAVAHLLWSNAAVPEAYPLTAAFLTAALLLCRRLLADPPRGAFLLGLLAGLSVLHHRMLLSAGACAGLALAGVLVRRRAFAPAALRFVPGALLGLLPAAALALAGPAPSLLGGFSARLPGTAAAAGSALWSSLAYLALNLSPLGLPLAVAGAALLPRRAPGIALLLAALVIAGLAQVMLFSGLGDRHVMLLPAVLAGTVLVGPGAAALAERLPRVLAAALPAAVLLAAPLVCALLAATDLPRAAGFLRQASPEAARAFLRPWALHSPSAREYAREVAAALPRGAVLLSGWGEGMTFRYLAEVEAFRPDLDFRIGPPGSLPAAGRSVYATVFPHTSGPGKPEASRIASEVLPGRLYRLRDAPPGR